MLSTVLAVDKFLGYVPTLLSREETQHIRKEAVGWPFYLPTHVNHPCNIWARTSLENYEYLFQYLLELGWEKQHRYPDKPMHKSVQLMIEQDTVIKHLPSKGLTPFAMAMPEDYKEQAIDAVDAYRTYYVCEKWVDRRGNPMASWKNRPVPDWWYEIVGKSERRSALLD
jgi:hypothetical protein